MKSANEQQGTGGSIVPRWILTFSLFASPTLFSVGCAHHHQDVADCPSGCPACHGCCHDNGPIPYSPYACRYVTPIARYHGWETLLIPTRATDSVSQGYRPEWP